MKLLILFVSELINAQKLLRPTYQEAFREFKCNTDPYEKRDDFTQSETDRGLWEMHLDSLKIENNNGTLLLSHPDSNNRVANAQLSYRLCDLDIMEGNITLSGNLWVSENNSILVAIKQDSIASKQFYPNEAWQPFELTIPYKNCTYYKKGSVAITLAGIFGNSSFSKIKDLQITCNGRDIDLVCPLPKANQDTAFSESSQFRFKEPVTDEQVKRLETICRVWGYLKYHHPCIMRGDYDWNNELFRMLPLIYDKGNFQHFCKELQKRIPPQTIQEQLGVKSTDSIIGKVSKDWIYDLPRSLRKNLIEIEKGPRYKQNYALSYGWIEPEKKFIKFLNETTYPNISCTDDGYRMLCLFRYWNMMYYFHPYMYLKDKEWQQNLSQYIRSFSESNDEYSFEKNLVALVCSLKDSHSDFYGLKSNILQIGGNGPWGGRMYIPMVTRLRDNYLVVASFLNDKMLSSGIKLGDRITKINQKSVPEIYQERSIYSPFYNPNSDSYGIAYQAFDSDSVNLELIRNNDTISITIDNVYEKCWTGNMIGSDSNIISHKDYGNSIYYINLSTLSATELQKVLDKVSEYKQIIFDCRGYRCDFKQMDVLADFLFEKPRSPFFNSYIDIREPGVVKKNPILPIYGKENPNYYKGNVYALVDGETMSFSEWLANLIKAAPKGKICGSKTTGVLGSALAVPLLPGIRTRYTGCGVYHHNGSCSYYDGCPIDVHIDPTLIGEDALNTLLKLIKRQTKITMTKNL